MRNTSENAAKEQEAAASPRVLTVKNLYEKKAKTYALDGIWGEVLGEVETSGAWLVYGREKNGKTWLAVKLADYLSTHAPTLYVSAEEGLSAHFQATCQRARLSADNRLLKFMEYWPLSRLSEKLSKQRSAKIVFIDNMTVYKSELRHGGLERLLRAHKSKLFVFVAHEKNNEPFTAAAGLCKILSKIILRVEGLTCEVSGRCPGGQLTINEERAELYHGSLIPSGNEE